MTISFISAGLIGLKAGIGIIFGANLGTTATAWLVSIFGLKIDISALALPMLAFGIVFVFQRSKSLKGVGHVLAGLGFFFLGIHYMKMGFDGYQETIDLVAYAIPGIRGLIIYTLLGVVITLILQSSSAAMALILTALAAGQIEYVNSLALAIGANIGTTITAILGSLTSNVAGKRLAGAHLIFNTVTAILAIAFLSQLSTLVNIISDNVGMAPNKYTIKLSIFHSIFNFFGVVVMIPLIRPLVKLLTKVVPDEKTPEEAFEYPVFLNENVLAYPQSAIKALLDESKRLFETATYKIVAHGLNLHRSDIEGSSKLKQVVYTSKEEMEVDIEEIYYRKIKIIYSTIIEYATRAQGKFILSSSGTKAFTRIKLANRKIVETIKSIRGLRKNVNLYMTSENEYIQKEYNRLRIKVAKVLRECHHVRMDESKEGHIKRLENLKNEAAKSDVLIDGTLDKLIRGHKITSQMATSLANDSSNVAGIIKKLIEIAELLYVHSDTLMLVTESNGNGRGK